MKKKIIIILPLLLLIGVAIFVGLNLHKTGTFALSNGTSDTEEMEKKDKVSLEMEEEKEGYGTTPNIDPHANAQVESAVEALETGEHPERLSTLLYSEETFDLEVYRADPEAYLSIAEPGRAFQPAQPGSGVPRIQPMHPPYKEVEQGKSVTLSVKGVPNSPVTFTSTDLGIFENQLTTITVATDEEGVAKAGLIASSGTIADVNILAASPVTSGQIKMIVHITKPSTLSKK